jgi:hypothetical protein
MSWQSNMVKKFRHVKIDMKGYESDQYQHHIDALKNAKNKRYGVIVIINDVTRTVDLEKSLSGSKQVLRAWKTLCFYRP